ncbi:MAG TPA: ABC transporter permease [Gemmatimonadaceae bacterium]
MDILLQDLRYAARKLLRTPGFTIIAISTLALAIGATTAVFSIVNSVLLRPLPVREPHELMAVGTVGRDLGSLGALSAPDFRDYQARSRSFAGFAGMDRGNANLTIQGSAPIRLETLSVGANFFDLLGVPLERGRGFLTNEDATGAARVVVISDKLWRSQFNADPSIVGKSVSLNGNSYNVVGIAPRELVYPQTADVWMPLIFEDWMLVPDNRGMHFFTAIGRLRTGITPDAGRRELRSIGDALAKEFPQTNTTIRADAMPLDENIVGNARATLYTMLGAVGFVLLIACANVANLLLIRASTRETEMALRTALGAGRSRIIRQLITESVLLAIGGALIGVALAMWGVDLIVAIGPRGLPRVNDITVDGRVLAFTAGLSLFTGIVFGMVPALYSARPEIAQMLRDSGRSSSGRRARTRVRALLVVAEVTLAVVLLVGSGLLIRSYMKLIDVNPGFRPEQVTTFSVSAPEVKYPYDRDRNRFADDVIAALRQLPGTRDAAVAYTLPMQNRGMRTEFNVDGQPPAAPDARKLTFVRPASPGYFSALGIQLVRGRVFTEAENRYGPPPVVVVSEAFVKKYFPNEDPIGKHITLSIDHDSAKAPSTVASKGEIVGIVADVKQATLKEAPSPATYLPHGTFPQDEMSFIVRSNADVATLTAAIRKRMAEIDPDMPIYEMETMAQAISGSVAQPRFYMGLLSGFAGLALLLAALGIYGVISYGVNQRVRELGIRIALGASNESILKLILGQGLVLVGSGLVIGIIGALLLTRLLTSMLYGVTPTDAPTLLIVPVTLAATALLASYLPARRAARVDPVTAMRSE